MSTKPPSLPVTVHDAILPIDYIVQPNKHYSIKQSVKTNSSFSHLISWQNYSYLHRALFVLSRIKPFNEPYSGPDPTRLDYENQQGKMRLDRFNSLRHERFFWAVCTCLSRLFPCSWNTFAVLCQMDNSFLDESSWSDRETILKYLSLRF